MTFRVLILSLSFLLAAPFSLFAQNAPADAAQQISDFSLAGYAEKGKKAWDLSGKSADIFNDIVKLDSVVGNLYGKEDDVKLTADKGDFNKADGKVHLEQNVVITTSSGAKLLTDSLDWDRKAQVVTTQDNVNIQRDNMVTVAKGIRAEPSLKKVFLEKEVRLDIKPSLSENPTDAQLKEEIIITCDGPLEIDYGKNIASFNNNVKVDKNDAVIYSEKMDVYFIPNGSGKETGAIKSSIDKIIARGNVKVVRGENVSYSEQAVYTASDKRLVLNGRPKLIIYSAEDFKDASLGN